jgi:hypothetical protein
MVQHGQFETENHTFAGPIVDKIETASVRSRYFAGDV